MKTGTIPLFQYISAAVTDGKLPRDFSLPKSESDDDMPVFADGALDGIAVYHMDDCGMEEEDRALMVRALLEAGGRNAGKDRSVDDFERAAQLFAALGEKHRAIFVRDPLKRYVESHRSDFKAGDLYEAALYFLLETPDRECVKFGLILLELLDTDHNEAVKQDVRTVGLSDEFTLFAVFVMLTWRDGNNEIFRLAQKVHGWGRIHAITYLEPRASSVKKWLLTQAVQNDVMDSYSALDCWNKADAWFVLRNHPTYEQFAGIRKILHAFMEEGPAARISALKNRDEVLACFLDVAERMTLTLDDYQVIFEINSYYKERGDGYTRHPLDFKSKKILLTYHCWCVVIDAVKEGRAMELALGCGIDVKRYVPDLLKASVKEHMHLCRYVMHDEECRKETLETFRQALSPEQIKTTPGTTLGLGDDYWKEHALEYLLQELRQYPGEGTEFVEAALQTEPVRTRNSALYLLECWVTREEKPLKEILPELYGLLVNLRDAEPTEHNQKRIDNLLSGATVFDDIPAVKKDPEYDGNSLNILADAISDIGCWQWWHTDDDVLQLEFCDVELYDDAKEEKDTRSATIGATIAVRFYGDYFAVFLDNLEEEDWYVKLHLDQIPPVEVDAYELAFDDVKYAKNVMKAYRHRHPVRPRFDESLFSEAKHILAGKCGSVGFVVGGDRIEVAGHGGIYTAEQIEEANKRWWNYWEDYWKKRKTPDAYEKDRVCEVTITVSP